MQTNPHFALISQTLRHLTHLSVPRHKKPNCRYGENCRFATSCFYNHANQCRSLYTHSPYSSTSCAFTQTEDTCLPTVLQANSGLTTKPVTERKQKQSTTGLSPLHPQAKSPTHITTTTPATSFAFSNQFNLLYNLSNQAEQPLEEPNDNCEEEEPWIAVTHQKRRKFTKQSVPPQLLEPTRIRCKSCFKEFYIEPDTVKWVEDRGLLAPLLCQECRRRLKELDKSKVCKPTVVEYSNFRRNTPWEYRSEKSSPTPPTVTASAFPPLVARRQDTTNASDDAEEPRHDSEDKSASKITGPSDATAILNADLTDHEPLTSLQSSSTVARSEASSLDLHNSSASDVDPQDYIVNNESQEPITLPQSFQFNMKDQKLQY